MTTSDWIYYIATKVGYWVEPVAYLVGLVVTVLAYRHSRKGGYLIVGVHFIVAASMLTLVPVVKRAMHRHWDTQHELSPEARAQFAREYEALYEKYYPATPRYATSKIAFPLGPVLLVAGVFVLARRDMKSSAEPITGAIAD
jgi:hypothetical protein